MKHIKMPVTWQRVGLRIACLFLLASLLGGCATAQDPRDPFEPFNRKVYSFNEGVDKAVFKPAAEVYQAVLPQFVRTGVGNFFSNLNDILVALNNVLQGKLVAALNDFSRVSMNTTIGLLGFLDVASEAGIEKHDEDFGQTLGWWGVGNGPFIMLPILGPSTARDVVGRIGDYFTDPVTYVDPTRSRNQLRGSHAVSRRADLLGTSTILQTAALDPYEFLRDAYLQRRRNLIYDGAPPPDREFMDPPVKSRNSVLERRDFTASADSPSVGSVLVAGDPATPVQSTFQTVAEPDRASVTPKADHPSLLSRLRRVIQP